MRKICLEIGTLSSMANLGMRDGLLVLGGSHHLDAPGVDLRVLGMGSILSVAAVET